MENANELPYEGAKAHCVLDIGNRKLVTNAIEILLAVTPLPKKSRQLSNGLCCVKSAGAGFSRTDCR